jgi:prepilin-type N-terminal cleavage/methylation domain-containing protein
MTKKGFTLIELMVATIISLLMVLSLTAIFSTASKYFFKSYRQNNMKNGDALAMKAITARLQEANRLDLPPFNLSGNTLAFAINVDAVTGCYPVNQAEKTLWYYYCYSAPVTNNCPDGNCLFQHTGQFTGTGGGGCPPAATVQFWNFPSGQYTVGLYPVTACGPGGGGTVTLLTSFLAPAPVLFSRTASDVVADSLVKIRLPVHWDPKNASSAPLDYALATTVRANLSAR